MSLPAHCQTMGFERQPLLGPPPARQASRRVVALGLLAVAMLGAVCIFAAGGGLRGGIRGRPAPTAFARHWATNEGGGDASVPLVGETDKLGLEGEEGETGKLNIIGGRCERSAPAWHLAWRTIVSAQLSCAEWALTVTVPLQRRPRRLAREAEGEEGRRPRAAQP